MRFFSRGPLPEEKRKVTSRTGTEPEPESPEKTHEASESNVALSEDEEMKFPGRNIVEELTQQFALIDPKNSSDLEAVGEALVRRARRLGARLADHVLERLSVLPQQFSHRVLNSRLVEFHIPR